MHQDPHGDSLRRNLTVNSVSGSAFWSLYMLASTAPLPAVDDDLCCDASAFGTYLVLIFCISSMPAYPT